MAVGPLVKPTFKHPSQKQSQLAGHQPSHQGSKATSRGATSLKAEVMDAHPLRRLTRVEKEAHLQ